MHRATYRQSGVSLIEVLVTLVIIAIALLGSATLQVISKRSNYEAIQRTTASNLAYDLLERIRANPSGLDNYIPDADLGSGSLGDVPNVDCGADGANCVAADLAEFDLWHWERQLDGNAEIDAGTATGGLLDAQACISGPLAGGAGMYTVAIAWRGMSEHTNPGIDACGEGLDLYGTDEEFRHVIVMQTSANTF